jgi:aspartokinase/homoserine dehydrogenase 1
MTGSVDDFYASMEKEETHYKAILDAAKTAGKKVKFVASYDNGKAAVGLQQQDNQSDCYH